MSVIAFVMSAKHHIGISSSVKPISLIGFLQQVHPRGETICTNFFCSQVAEIASSKIRELFTD